MSDEQEKDETQWNFEVEGVKTEGENVERKARKERLAQKLGQKEEKRDAKKDLMDGQPKRMKLDAAPTSGRKSRSKLAEEMRQAEIPDFNDLMASPVKRAIAGIIDAAIFLGLLYVANTFWPTIEEKILIYLRENSINQPLDPGTFKNLVMGIIAVTIYYVVIAIPACFTRQSWGKSFTSLSIHSADEEKELGFFTILFRELIAKPISIAIVFGPLLMLFNDEKRSLHDMVSGTVVMDDKIEAKS
ncbi:MAG: hypothetical protein CME70_13270 [Halobacteriovorax sp.]|nr:hypothetical protein [Halobacteriovorax sp.]|tara:strand:- start:70483 stop:71217 length:735 start_codon:yes stop_codon:yes gene_type:complete